MTTLVRVAIDVPVPRLFDYVCEGATERDIGARAVVSFGRRRMVGIIVEIGTTSDVPVEKLKSCEAILREIPPLPEDLMALGKFCSAYYQVPIGEALLAALPPRLRRPEPLAIAADRSLRRLSLTETGRMTLPDMPARQKTRRRMLEAMLAASLSEEELLQVPGCSRAHIRDLLEKGWIDARVPERDPVEFVTTHILNEHQSQAVAEVGRSSDAYTSFLLLGITGSGKTEVYLNLIAQAIAAGRQALVLVPEIALTPSLEALFRQRFRGAFLCVQHSNMGDAERARTWIQAANGEANIVLGTRLAVFVPMPRLGLVVVDEEQDASYKQQDGVRYSARDLAIVRARQAKVPVLLCSATPSLETLHHAQSGRYRLLRLPRRAHEAARLPAMRLIDTRQSPMKEGLSQPLLQALALRLERGEQSVLFLNRRGYAPVLACGHCGWVSGCPRCSVNLVVHLGDKSLRCHHCGYQARIPRTCAQCGNLDLAPFGRGTQRLESEVSEKFPSARVLRIDSDSAGGNLKRLLETAQSGGADILVGTQILAKGHHFEKVTLVGVLNADAGLFAADYRAPERLFAQLQQVSGRAGRADLPGEVLIQTRYPTHPLYMALQQHDYEGYARELLDQRRAAGFPPFMHEAALRAHAERMQEALSFLDSAIALAPDAPDALTIYDPAPATVPKLANLERAQVVIQSHSRPQLQEFLKDWNARLREKMHKVRWHFDVDPLEF